MTAYKLRPQAEVEQRLLDLIEQLPDVPATPERASWYVGQIASLLYALGATERQAIDAAYRLWRARGREPPPD